MSSGNPIENAALEAPAHEARAPAAPAGHRFVLWLLLICAFIVILNETIIGVAMPRLMADLGVTASAAQWLTTAFLLTMAVVIPITGFMLQRFNTRPIFVFAMAMFSAGTLLSALAPGLGVLVLGRIVQAVGTAVMMPLLMTTAMTVVPPHERGRTMGTISVVMSMAPAIGPTVSGLVLSVLDWRWMFWLVLPIALAPLIIGGRRVVNISTPREVPLDILSVILSAIGFGALVYGLSQFGEAAGHPAAVPPAVPTIGGAVVIALFVIRQLMLQRHDKALLDLRTLRTRTYTIAVFMIASSMMSLFGMIILLPLYLQNVLGLDTLGTGLLVLPGGLIMGLVAPGIGRLYDRYGPTVLVVPGSVVIAAALFAMSLMGPQTAVAWALANHVGLSIGLALMFTPLFTAGLGALPPALYAHGSAIVATMQQVAGAAGTAIFVAIMTARSASLAAGGMDAVPALSGGIATAFRFGAFLSLVAIAAAFFIRKPSTDAEPTASIGGH